MAYDRELQLALHRALDEVQLSSSIPPHVLRRARRQRGAKLFALGAVVVIAIGYFSTSGAGLLSSVRIAPARGPTVPFASLPVETGSEVHGLVGSPLAPEAFPDCSDELVDVRPDIDRDSIEVTLRPLPGVQCGLDWSPEAVWVGADGERYVPHPSRAPFEDGPLDGRLLLMGDNGASHWAPISGPVCELEPPLRYFIKLGGSEVEVAALDDPGCSGPGAKRTQPFHYRMTGIETPAGWLDPELQTPETVEGHTLKFVLELTNDTAETIVLGRCPFFDATFATSSGKAELRSYLNCPAAPDEIPPGMELRFPIELALGEVSGSGRISFVLRDERRPLHRLQSDQIEVHR